MLKLRAMCYTVINENKNLKEKLNKLNKLNMDIIKIQDLEDKLKSLEKEINKKNEEIQQLLSENNNNQGKYKIASINPGEEIMCVNFASMNNQDLNNYGLICKNTDLFIRAKERLYEDFPQFKKYETYYEANGKRIKGPNIY